MDQEPIKLQLAQARRLRAYLKDNENEPAVATLCGLVLMFTEMYLDMIIAEMEAKAASIRRK